MSTKIVIVGCGFGGLAAARELARGDVTITLVDRSNHHLFQPLLYQVATAGLSAPSIAAPIRHILHKQSNLTVLMAEVTDIDCSRRIVRLNDSDELNYDYLIIAAGATHSYFNHPEWARFAPGLKTLDDAFTIRRRVLLAFEQAELHPNKQEEWLTFAVIGAGPTGVEMAGTLAEIARNTLRDEFRHIDSRRARIILLEGSERVLGSYPAELSLKAEGQLKRLGVSVRTSCRVSDMDEQGVWFDDGKAKQRLPARTIIWAAGVAASPLGKSLGVPLDRAGRVIVEPDLSISDHPEVFVIGDLAAVKSNGQPVPGVSPAAKQMGHHAARNILLKLQGKPTKIFHYRDYGSLATIGRNAAVAVVGPLKLSGKPAWLFWLFVHIFFLIGFRNRVVVMIDWAWAYWSFARYARVITEEKSETRWPKV